MNNRIVVLYFSLLALLVLASCKNNSHSPECAFYYWKTTYNIDSSENNYLQSLNVKKLYVRFFDVDKDNSTGIIFPLAHISGLKFDARYQIIPTIFITNKTFHNLSDSAINDLAGKVRNNIVALYDSNNIKEIQFDCDWSKTTKTQYFKFLQNFRNRFPQYLISATVRLHQIKYSAESGVPPVNSAMLMVYNVDKIADSTTENSILNINTVDEYLEKLSDYPLHLDVALPIFSQGVLFRNTKAICLINNLEESELNEKNNFQKIEDNRYKSLVNSYFCGKYIYANDIIRVEEVEQNDLEKIAKRLSKKIKNKDINIVFFHLDSGTIKRFNKNEIKSIIDIFY